MGVEMKKHLLLLISILVYSIQTRVYLITTKGNEVAYNDYQIKGKNEGSSTQQFQCSSGKIDSKCKQQDCTVTCGDGRKAKLNCKGGLVNVESAVGSSKATCGSMPKIPKMPLFGKIGKIPSTIGKPCFPFCNVGSKPAG